MRRARTTAGGSILVLVVALVAATVEAARAGAGGPRTWHVAVAGTGDCTAPAAACGSLDAAYLRAGPGDVIEVAGGTYPDQRLSPRVLHGPPVVARPAPGADVSLGRVDVHGQGITVSGMRVGPLTLHATAERAGFDRVTVDAPDRQALTLRRGSTQVFVTRSRLTGGADHDRIQVQGAVDARLEGNLVGGTTLSPGATAHVDCLQVLAADGLLVARNRFFACAGQTVLVQDTFGWGVERVRFERNVVSDCGRRDASCSAPFAVHLGTPGTTWIHNTVAGGVRVLASAPQTLRGNIFGALLFDWAQLDRLCFGSTLVDHLLTTNCPAALLGRAPNGGNAVGVATFVDHPGRRPGPDGPDLHLRAASLGIDVGTAVPPPPDIDGQGLHGPADLGADEWHPGGHPRHEVGCSCAPAPP